MALCTDVNIDENKEIIGEPTEAALVAYALTLDLNKNDLSKSEPRVAEKPSNCSP